ncbi:DUF881 domain-containing protein [Cellulomonas rhizosphaerae]|uniref:DUF881 domain-containing protein n=1 Tax=Cellulomonas rhizosphaerae TaxID=2293719 RepID=A0A413RLD5_9CELL|nr:DUF881 domain-containing protein [Cellulomonas rhizosphaerae]RHA40723.1 DUF881 domain-containing protein [Cellulomonas rhizosphaerae]
MTSRHADGAGDVQVDRRPDASMTLLTEFYRRPLDPGYALAAERRAAGDAPPRRRIGLVGLVVLAVLLGLGTAAATAALRQPVGQVSEARRVLESQITERGDEAAELQQQALALSDEIATMQSSALGSADEPLQSALTAGAVEAGSLAADGPGLRVVLTDAKSDNPDAEDPDNRVQDIDLQVLVNGLWEAGAEAIAINGQRLTSMTAIRSAGSAVLVDLVALSSPYTVEAIGDSVQMQTELARTSTGQLLATLRATYGIGVDMSSERRLELPGAGLTALRSASVPEDSRLPVPASDAPSDPVSSGGAGVAGSAGRAGGGGQ